MMPTLNSPIMADPTGAYARVFVPRTDLLTSARQRLEQQAAGGAPTDPAAAEPSASAYGVFGPQYAAALARSTGTAGGDILNRTALGLEAQGEREAYTEALERAHRGAVQLADIEGRNDANTALIGQVGPMAQYGVLGGVGVRQNPDGGYGLFVDPITGMRRSNQVANSEHADNLEKYGKYAESLYNVGMQEHPDVVAARSTHPDQLTVDPSPRYLNPRGIEPGDDIGYEQLPIEMLKAEAAMVAARAAQTRAENPDDLQITVQDFGGEVPPVTTYRGTPEQVAPYSRGNVTPRGQSDGSGEMSPQQSRAVQNMPQGYRSIMSEGILVIVAPSGARAFIGPDGQRLPAPTGGAPPGGARGGGSRRPTSRNRAGRVERTTYSRNFDPISTIRSHYGVSPTSGYRTQSHQDDLRRRRLTRTRTGSHQRRDGMDFPTPRGMSKQRFIDNLRRDFPFARVIPSNGNAVHITFPGWGGAPDVSGSARRFPDR